MGFQSFQLPSNCTISLYGANRPNSMVRLRTFGAAVRLIAFDRCDVVDMPELWARKKIAVHQGISESLIRPARGRGGGRFGLHKTHLADAFHEGFDVAEELLGGKLPGLGGERRVDLAWFD